MIYMERIDPAARMRRFYRVTIERTLFGDWALVREWGRIGCAGGQHLEEWFPDQGAAAEALAGITAAKRRRGYAAPALRGSSRIVQERHEWTTTSFPVTPVSSIAATA
jgi:predicted DNA-binding WGR domain protein